MATRFHLREYNLRKQLRIQNWPINLFISGAVKRLSWLYSRFRGHPFLPLKDAIGAGLDNAIVDVVTGPEEVPCVTYISKKVDSAHVEIPGAAASQ